MRSNQSGELAGHARVLAAAAAVVMVLITGCRPQAREEKRPAVAAPARAAARDCDPSIDDEARRAAMVSVYVQAYSDAGLLHGETTQSLRVPLINDAVRTLNRDCDPLAPARRRRAVAKLAAYGGEKDPSASAWRMLAKDPALIQKIHDLIVVRHLSPPFESPESKLYDETLSMADDCRAHASDPVFTGPPPDPRSGVVSWEVSFTVQETLDWLAPRLDPQNWHKCGQFPETKYTTDTLPDVLPHVSSCSSSPTANPAANDPKTPGSAPYHANLFEHFECKTCLTEAENLLDVTTAAATSCGSNPCDAAKGMDPNPAHQICYSLPCSGTERTECGDPPVGQSTCCSKALYFCAGSPAHHMDMVIDQGDLTACKLTSGTGLRAIARKNVKFDSAWQTFQTYILYYVGQQATIEGFLDIACCDLP